MIYLKSLIVLLGLSVVVFTLAKPVALQFSAEDDFKRRRNVWMALTIVAFVSPNIWLFALVAAPVLYWGGKRDSNPLAFYLLLLTIIPPVSRQIPTVGIKQLFDLDIYRLLSFCVLIPAAWRLRKSPDPGRIRGLRGTDLLLLAYGALQAVLFVSPDPIQSHGILHNSFTNTLRTVFLFYVDVYVLYYVASRGGKTRDAIREALAAFVLSSALIASIAVFESTRHWLLYTDFFARWGGDQLRTEYYMRAGLLRAEASSGQPLALGFLLTVAIGFWLYLRSCIPGQLVRKTAVTILLLMGLFVSFSRGPWLAALVVFLAYSAFGGAGRASGLMKAAMVTLLLGGLVLLSPYGTTLRQVLPFSDPNSAAQASLMYRKELLDRSWQIIQAHPLLGDQLALSDMQDLRQGEGIIDVVNTYLGVTLFYGFTGIVLFVTFQLLPLYRTRRALRRLSPSDSDDVLLAIALAATIIGSIILLADSSFRAAPKCIFYVLIATAEAYLALRYSTTSRAASAAEIQGKSPIAVPESS